MSTDPTIFLKKSATTVLQYYKEAYQSKSLPVTCLDFIYSEFVYTCTLHIHTKNTTKKDNNYIIYRLSFGSFRAVHQKTFLANTLDLDTYNKTWSISNLKLVEGSNF